MRVKTLHGFHAFLENPRAALRVGEVLLVIRQRRNHLDTVSREELRQILLALAGSRIAVELHREVMPHHDVLSERDGTFDKTVEIRMQLRCAAGDVEPGDLRMPIENLQALRDRFGRHHFFAIRRGVDVAVAARLVAELRNVNLQCIDRKRRQVYAPSAQLLLEVVLRR